MNLKEKFILYLKAERNYSENTITSYKRDLEQFEDFLKNYDSELDFENADRNSIRHFLGSLSENGLKGKSVSRKLSTLKSFYKFLQIRKIIEKNPTSLIGNPKIEKKLPKVLTSKEIERLIELPNSQECESEEENFIALRDKLIFEIFYGTGMRVSELINLKVSSFNFGNETVKIFGKGSKDRIVPYGKKVDEILNQFLEFRIVFLPKESEFIFTNPKGKQISRQKVSQILKKYLSKITEREGISPHTLRHTFATHMLDAGADIKYIRELLGHESLSSTQIYTHTSIEELKQTYKLAHPRAGKR